MKKLFIFFLLIIFPINCFALDFPTLNSKSVIVFDRNDDKILYSYNDDKLSSIASLTKIVTTIVAIEKISNLDDTIKITPEILYSVDPVASKAGLNIGDIVTYRDLLYASILPSGADATNALAFSLSGSIDNFVNDMNLFIERLNLKNTHFVNVTGLDADNHYSTVNDILKILDYSLNNKLFYEIFTTKKYTLSNGLDVYSTLYKYNGDDINVIKGSKTGFTGNAGYCIATLSETDGHEIISIFLNAEHIDNLYYNIVDSVELINFVNQNYSNVLLNKENNEIVNIPVELCDIDNYVIKSKSNIYKFLSSDYNEELFRYEYNGLDILSYTNVKGDKLGEIIYYYGDEIVFKEDVYLDKDLNISYLKVLKKYLFYVIFGFLSLIFVILFLILLIKRKNNTKNSLLVL